MNIFKTIMKAAKAVVRTVKELFGLTKAAYQAKGTAEGLVDGPFL